MKDKAFFAHIWTIFFVFACLIVGHLCTEHININKTTCQWTTTGLIKKWWCGDGGGVFNFGRCLWGPQWVGKWGLHPTPLLSPTPLASHHWRTGWWHSICDSLTEGMSLRVWRGWYTNKLLKRYLSTVIFFNVMDVQYTSSVWLKL